MLNISAPPNMNVELVQFKFDMKSVKYITFPENRKPLNKLKIKIIPLLTLNKGYPGYNNLSI